MSTRMDIWTGTRRIGVGLGIAILIAALTVPVAGAAFTTERVSVSTSGAQANDDSSDPDISTTGKFVAYDSEASNLVPSDTNGHVRDVFVRNRAAGVTSMVSKTKSGAKGNGPSHDPSISGNGRWVAFWSEATNFIRGGDKNGAKADVFVKDRKTGRLELISKRSNGKQGNGPSYDPTISKGGRFVAFESDATNLVFKDVNDHRDVFLHDRKTGKTILVSRSTKGVRGNDDSVDGIISPGGKYVAYESDATNLIASDPNGFRDVFLFDRITKKNTLVSRGSRGNDQSVDAAVPAGANFVYFTTDATNLVTPDTNGDDDVVRRNRSKGKTTRASANSAGVQGNAFYGDGSESPDVAETARFLTWEDDSTNLGPKNGANTSDDVWWRNMKSGITKLVSKSTAGVAGNDESNEPKISYDGRFVAYQSDATNLVASDTNGDQDIFVSGPMRS